MVHGLGGFGDGMHFTGIEEHQTKEMISWL